MNTTPDALAKVSEADLQRLLRLLNESLLTAPNVRIPLMDAITELLRARERIKEMDKERDRLSALINNPHTDDFLDAVRTEAAHQRERWASDHDAGKTDADWFWLVGYLAGKALNKPEKQLHHIITTAAALLNWHAAKTGDSTVMRPGIDAAQPGAKEMK